MAKSCWTNTAAEMLRLDLPRSLRLQSKFFIRKFEICNRFPNFVSQICSRLIFNLSDIKLFWFLTEFAIQKVIYLILFYFTQSKHRRVRIGKEEGVGGGEVPHAWAEPRRATGGWRLRRLPSNVVSSC